jgi:hypothetical protein
VVAAVGCTLAVAACGSSSKPGGAPSASDRYASSVRFSDCMRSHGVPNFPDPNPSDGEVRITPASGLNPQAPAFLSAHNACAGTA